MHTCIRTGMKEIGFYSHYGNAHKIHVADEVILKTGIFWLVEQLGC